MTWYVFIRLFIKYHHPCWATNPDNSTTWYCKIQIFRISSIFELLIGLSSPTFELPYVLPPNEGTSTHLHRSHIHQDPIPLGVYCEWILDNLLGHTPSLIAPQKVCKFHINHAKKLDVCLIHFSWLFYRPLQYLTSLLSLLQQQQWNVLWIMQSGGWCLLQFEISYGTLSIFWILRLASLKTHIMQGRG